MPLQKCARESLGSLGSDLASLDASASSVEPFATHFLKVRVRPQAGVACDTLSIQLQHHHFPGVRKVTVRIMADLLFIQAKVVPAMDKATLVKILSRFDGVQTATGE